MKLRLRSAETKETLGIEVPSPSTLRRLQEILSQRIPSFSGSPSSLHLSLNRKDDLVASSPQEDSLRSLGITSGDLLFFTLDPNGFSRALSSHSNVDCPPSSRLPQISGTLPDSDRNSNQERPSGSRPMDLDDRGEESVSVGSEKEQIMEVDAVESKVSRGISFSVPGFLRKVFTKELGDDDGLNHKLVVIAVHAVLLESGFLGFNPASNETFSEFLLTQVWPSSAFRMSLSYTLREITGRGGHGSDSIDHAVLKFQSLGNFMNVYGSMANGSSATHSVRLDESWLVPYLNVVWANCGSTEQVLGQSTTPEREVFMFWRTVKDRIALPLLIDLCDRQGLPLPACFMRLPTDLKLRILESLPAIDLVNCCFLCSELRYLASNDDLWRLKFLEEFGDGDSAEGRGCWKDKFANCWKATRKSNMARSNGSVLLMSREITPFPLIINREDKALRWWPGRPFRGPFGVHMGPRARNVAPHRGR